MLSKQDNETCSKTLVNAKRINIRLAIVLRVTYVAERTDLLGAAKKEAPEICMQISEHLHGMSNEVVYKKW